MEDIDSRFSEIIEYNPKRSFVQKGRKILEIKKDYL